MTLIKISLSVFCFAIIGALQLASSGLVPQEIISKCTLVFCAIGVIAETFEFVTSKLEKIFRK